LLLRTSENSTFFSTSFRSLHKGKRKGRGSYRSPGPLCVAPWCSSRCWTRSSRCWRRDRLAAASASGPDVLNLCGSGAVGKDCVMRRLMKHEVGGSSVTNDYITDFRSEFTRCTLTGSLRTEAAADLTTCVNKPILITTHLARTGDISRVCANCVGVDVGPGLRIGAVDLRNPHNVMKDTLDQYGLLISWTRIVYGERFGAVTS
jgi:hypothetical protein